MNTEAGIENNKLHMQNQINLFFLGVNFNYIMNGSFVCHGNSYLYRIWCTGLFFEYSRWLSFLDADFTQIKICMRSLCHPIH